MFAILYWASPNAKRGFRLISPGSVLAVVLWLIASGLFALYVANFGSYNKVYGSLAAVIIFLVWMWISNIAVLIGAQFNAELERERAIAGGYRPMLSGSPNCAIRVSSARRRDVTSASCAGTR
jgi:membrane protein